MTTTCTIQCERTGRFLFIKTPGEKNWRWLTFESFGNMVKMVEQITGCDAEYNAFTITNRRSVGDRFYTAAHVWVDSGELASDGPFSEYEIHWAGLGEFPEDLAIDTTRMLDYRPFLEHCISG